MWRTEVIAKKAQPESLRRTRRRLAIRFLCLFLLSSACAPVEEEADAWPRWRGDGSGVSSGGPYPTRWSPESGHLRWSTEIPGVGNSSPIVDGDRIWLTAAWPADEAESRSESLPEADAAAANDAEAYARRGGEFWRGVLVFDRESGSLLHRVNLFVAKAERTHRTNTLAAPSPVAEGDSAWFYFGSHLARVDRDGEVIWLREIDPSYHDSTRYGASSSPTLTTESVIVVRDKEWARTEDDPGWMAAFDRESGERRWRIEWEHTCCSYSTPLVATRGSGEEIVFAHSGEIVGYAASDGRKLWSHDVKINQMVSSPLLDGDRLYVAGGAHQVRGVLALELEGSGAATRATPMWFDIKSAPQISSPLLVDGRLVMVTEQGVATARDPGSGEILWQGRLSRPRNRASLVAGDGKIYVTSTNGWIEVLRSGPAFESLSVNHLGELGTNASPALVDGCLLVRTRSRLICIEALTEGGGR